MSADRRSLNTLIAAYDSVRSLMEANPSLRFGEAIALAGVAHNN